MYRYINVLNKDLIVILKVNWDLFFIVIGKNVIFELVVIRILQFVNIIIQENGVLIFNIQLGNISDFFDINVRYQILDIYIIRILEYFIVKRLCFELQKFFDVELIC